MPNHPNRAGPKGPLSLTATQLADLRARCGITQERAAELARAPLRKYQKWEYGEHKMPRASSELLLVSCLICGYIPSAFWIAPYVSDDIRALIPA